jgi:hypothetical protein
MTFISAGERLEQAVGLAAVLGAAYEAFEGMRREFRAREDPTTRWFGGFVMAAAAAADGRDAVAFAPSMPARQRRGAAGTGRGLPAGESAGRAAGEAAELSRRLAECLARAAELASDRGDRDACQHACRCAGEIFDLFSRVGP